MNETNVQCGEFGANQGGSGLFIGAVLKPSGE